MRVVSARLRLNYRVERDSEHRAGRFPMNIARLSHGPAEWRAGAFAILLLLIIPAAGCATAPSQDYRFDVVQQPVKVGRNSEIAVRLVHLPSGEAVKDAIISKGELEMPMLQSGYKINPSGLSLSDAHVEYLGSDGQGTYRFRGDVSMAGTWTLKIRARVPGEAETVRGAAMFRAVS
jgi:hypothetical protein